MSMQHLIGKIGIFIGQAPPEKQYDIPFGRTRLYNWFREINLEKDFLLENFLFDALVNRFQGKTLKKHNLPSKEEMEKYLPELIHKVNIDSIKIVIPVGKLAIEQVFCVKNVQLDDYIGKRFVCQPFGLTKDLKVVVPLPHPSGLSTWVFKRGNHMLLKKALDFILKEIS